jgi:tRNA (guanine37-N1)-methyltransferase
MVMMPEPLEAAIQAAKAGRQAQGCGGSRVVYLSPQGAPLTHQRVMRLCRMRQGGRVGAALRAL